MKKILLKSSRKRNKAVESLANRFRFAFILKVQAGDKKHNDKNMKK